MQLHPMRPKNQRRQAGFSMIEVLITIVIMAFGMLGLAGLQTRMLTFNQSSLFRSQAAALTDDILDRMRADRANAKAGNWNSPIGTNSAATSGSTLYGADIKDWKLTVESTLPSGAASIAVASNVVTITVQWDDTRGDDTAQQFVTKSQL